MRRPVTILATILLAVMTIFLTAGSCDGDNEKAYQQREESVEERADTFDRAKEKWPIPRNENFPVRGVLVEYTKRQDLVNHPWYTYIMSDDGRVTHYFVSTTVPVNSCAFLGSTEEIVTRHEGTIVVTAPSLDGVFYGGAGAASACNGWIFVDAATGVMGLAFGSRILTFDAPLVLETEPILIQPVAPRQ